MTDIDSRERGASTSRTLSIVATAVAGLAGAVVAGAVVGLKVAKDGAAPSGHNWWVVAWLVIGAVDAVIGAALVTRYGHRRLGGCLLVVGSSALLLALATEASFVVDVDPDTRWANLSGAADWAQPIATGVLAALIPWELAVVNRSRATEMVWWTTAALIAFVAIGTAAGAGHDVVTVAGILVGVSATVATLRLLMAWWNRRGDTDDPLPVWVAAGSLAAWLAVVPEMAEFGTDVPLGDVAASLMVLATVPLLVVAAIVDTLRDRPGRFHGVAHDVIGWLVLYGAIVVVYTGIVAGFGELLAGAERTWLVIAATGLVALVIEPMRGWISGTVDRLVWGARDDPLVVVRGVVEQVSADSSGEGLLTALASILQRDLRVDSVAIDVRTADGWRREAALGPPTTYSRTVELDQHGDVVGRLVVGWEHGPSLRARDEHVLAELVGPLGLALGWVRLAADLRRSSVAIVSAREEERRRLRRDLHDGLGPSLTGVSLGLRTALRQLERSPDSEALAPSRLLLARAADEVDSIVLEVKRIVRDLRPTALDQLGLVEAVIEFTRTFSDELDIQLRMPEERIELPAAVEVATYRIVTEAVTNVVRHAHAAKCWLTISAGDTVDIDVVDDGVGVDAEARNGVGLVAMRERAEELGGTVQVEPHEPHGTHLHVRLPAVLP
jgi:two-component system, NarL family, sensor kinase